jgi:predicted DNA-binding transcriptional regulator AlpA
MKQLLSIVPDSFLEKINEKQDQIIDLLKSTEHQNQNEFLTEKAAREFLQKKTTWFWQMRKDGLLPFRKIGKSIYYSKKEINQLLETSKQK